MPQFATCHFGTISYEPGDVFEFPSGLPGFEAERRFLALEQPRTKPVLFLQSLATPQLCFIAVPILAVEPGYALSVAPDDLREMGLPEDRQPRIGEEVLCLAIVCVREDGPPTANLLAPVVVNLRSRVAVQSIQAESGYSHQHRLDVAHASAGAAGGLR